MPQEKPNIKLSVDEFRDAVAPIIEFLYKQYQLKPEASSNTPWRRSALQISDVADINGSQYVDLVQEGGGVHGIALAGYTYVLEKMGVAFMKMAGTSAGSINTLLLSALTTRSELKIMQEYAKNHNIDGKGWEESQQYNPASVIPGKYYETRSEKMLEYLAAKNLGDLVDGHITWRTILLSMFTGKLEMKELKAYFRKVKTVTTITVVTFIIATLAGICLAFFSSDNSWQSTAQWVYRIGAGIIVLCLCFIIAQIVKARLLYRHSERFGINPGDDFESWMMKILEENGINNVSQLKSKLSLEKEALRPDYFTDDEKTDNSLFKSFSPAKRNKYDAKLDEIEAEINQANEPIFKTLDATQQKPPANPDNLNDRLTRMSIEISANMKDDEKDASGYRLVNLFTKVNKMKYDKIKYSDNTVFNKEIAIVSSDITNAIKAEFPGMHKMYWGENYNISPAKYVRASMSIPGFFKPFKIEYDPSQIAVMECEWRNLLNINKRFQDNDQYAYLVDGGVLSNFPVNIFYNANTPLPYKPTIGVKLEFEDDARSRNIDNHVKFAGSIVNTMRFFYDRDFISKHNNFKKTVRSIDTGEIHWLNFDMSDEQKIELFFRGALTAAIFLLGELPQDERAGYKRELVTMGSAIKFRGQKLCMYADKEKCSFMTEDNSSEDVSFNWNKYKKDRVLLPGEQQQMNNDMKRKASFSQVKDDEPKASNTSKP